MGLSRRGLADVSSAAAKCCDGRSRYPAGCDRRLGSPCHSGLLNAATADPGTLPVAIVVLDRHVTAGRVVNKTALQRLIDSTIQKHAPLGHGSEVAWALWLAIQFDVDIAAPTAKF